MYSEMRLVWELFRLKSIAVESESEFDMVVSPVVLDLKSRCFVSSKQQIVHGHQRVIEFDKPVVSFCRKIRNASEIPIQSHPSLGFHWQWLATGALACTLERKRIVESPCACSLSIAAVSMHCDGVAPTHHFFPRDPDIKWLSLFSWFSPCCPVIRLVFTWDMSNCALPRSLNHVAYEQPSRLAGRLSKDVPPMWLSSP